MTNHTVATDGTTPPTTPEVNEVDWDRTREVLVHVLDKIGGNIWVTSEEIADEQIAALIEDASWR